MNEISKFGRPQVKGKVTVRVQARSENLQNQRNGGAVPNGRSKVKRKTAHR